VANVMQQRSGAYDFDIRSNRLSDANCQVADTESMPGIVSRRFAVQVSAYLLLESRYPRGLYQDVNHWGNYTTNIKSESRAIDSVEKMRATPDYSQSSPFEYCGCTVA